MSNQNLFVGKDDVFVVEIVVATKGDILYCDMKENKEALMENIKDIDKTEGFVVKEYKVVFRRPSFSDTISLYDSVVKTTEDGLQINPIVARYQKMISLIKEWNLTGEVKKPTKEEIQKLHPMVAGMIGLRLDVETGGLLG